MPEVLVALPMGSAMKASYAAEFPTEKVRLFIPMADELPESFGKVDLLMAKNNPQNYSKMTKSPSG